MLMFSDLSHDYFSLLFWEIGLPLFDVRGFGLWHYSHQPAKVKGARRESCFSSSSSRSEMSHLL